jgi:hypothetical protein
MQRYLDEPVGIWAYRNQKLTFIDVDSKESWLKMKEHTIYSDTDILYEFNSLGFRSDEILENPLTDSKRVLFIGCSHTLGIGLPKESIWAYQFYEKLKKDNLVNCGFYNLSLGGTSIDYVSRVLNYYIKKVKPYAVFCAMPQLSRREIYISENLGPWTYSNNPTKYETFIDPNFILYQSEKNFTMIDLICQLYNCKFYFGTSSAENKANMSDSDNQMFATYRNELNNLHCYSKLRFKIEDYARDLKHYGHVSHSNYANDFYELCRDDVVNHVNSYLQVYPQS